LRAGSSTTISFPFLLSRPISTTEGNKKPALHARTNCRTRGVRGVKE
jgi:hypothetical protein